MDFIKCIEISNYLGKKYASIILDDNIKVLDYQIDMINNNPSSGLVAIEKIQFNEDIKFQYDITDLITLKEYINLPTTDGNMIITIFKNMISIIRSLDNYLLNTNNLLLTSDNLYVDINKKTILAIYVPGNIAIGNIESDFRLLVNEVAMNCMNDQGNTKKCFIDKILSLVKSDNYSINEVYMCLNSTGAKPKKIDIVITNEVEKNNKEDNTNKKINKSKGLFANLFNFKTKDKLNNKQNNIEKKTEKFSKEININKYKVTNDVMYETEIITKNFKAENEIGGYLIFSKNGLVEKVNINNNNFILGRMQGETDYTIDNMAVGKIHAKIVKENNIDYIIDLESKNGTFLNGERIMPNKLYALKNGDNLVLGNEKIKYEKN